MTDINFAEKPASLIEHSDKSKWRKFKAFDEMALTEITTKMGKTEGPIYTSACAGMGCVIYGRRHSVDDAIMTFFLHCDEKHKDDYVLLREFVEGFVPLTEKDIIHPV